MHNTICHFQEEIIVIVEDHLFAIKFGKMGNISFLWPRGLCRPLMYTSHFTNSRRSPSYFTGFLNCLLPQYSHPGTSVLCFPGNLVATSPGRGTHLRYKRGGAKGVKWNVSCEHVYAWWLCHLVVKSQINNHDSPFVLCRAMEPGMSNINKISCV